MYQIKKSNRTNIKHFAKKIIDPLNLNKMREAFLLKKKVAKEIR